MGIILKFEVPLSRGHRPPAVSTHGEPCEIVILPCVRYEPSVVAAPKRKPEKKKARKPRARGARLAQ